MYRLGKLYWVADFRFIKVLGIPRPTICIINGYLLNNAVCIVQIKIIVYVTNIAKLLVTILNIFQNWLRNRMLAVIKNTPLKQTLCVNQ